MDSTNRGNYVSGKLGYLIPMTQKPYNYMFEPPAGGRWENCDYEWKSCKIHDARQAVPPISLKSHGFELIEAPTSVADFYDPKEVADTYFREVRDLAKRITGGSLAVVFDHKLRMREEGRPPLTFGR